jgi:hypothetical protein
MRRGHNGLLALVGEKLKELPLVYQPGSHVP